MNSSLNVQNTKQFQHCEAVCAHPELHRSASMSTLASNEEIDNLLSSNKDMDKQRSNSISSESPSLLTPHSRESRFELDLFPDSPCLPFHFSFIDDGMIGGCSIPSTKMHYRALSDNGIGLVVNLTENMISPNIDVYGCKKINSNENVKDKYNDIFDDIHKDDELEVLFIPIRDGEVPTFYQVNLFLQESKKFIRAGKKVIVHCQAGIGRTGIMLASFLIDKYSITASEALTELRALRPHSLQFNAHTWNSDPFLITPPAMWNPNPVQEVYLDMFYESLFETRDEDGFVNSMDVPMALFYRGIISELLADQKVLDEDCCFACMRTPFVGPFQVYANNSLANLQIK